MADPGTSAQGRVRSRSGPAAAGGGGATGSSIEALLVRIVAVAV